MGFIMATLYQNKGHWLLTVHHKGRRLTKSLGTKDKKVAKQLKPYVESELLLELTGLKKAISQVPFPVLTDKFLKADKKRIKSYLDNSLMLVTALSPVIGYDNASKIAKRAYKNNTTLKEEAIKSNLINKKDYDKIVNPKKMLKPY